MNSNTLQHELDTFTGTEHWYRHPLSRALIYTDGVKSFARKAGAYWFLDAVALGVYGRPGIVDAMRKQGEQFAVALLRVTGSEATLEARNDYDEHDDTIGRGIYHEDILFTDAPEGTWKFYLIDDGVHCTLLLPSEY